MTTQSNYGKVQYPDNVIALLQPDAFPKSSQAGATRIRTINTDYFLWENMTMRIPLVHLLQPDYYCVFRFANPEAIVFQQNLHLELGGLNESITAIRQYLDPNDAREVRRTDSIIQQFASECRLQPFDYILSMILRWNGPDQTQRFLLRKTTILQVDENGNPVYGIMTIQDITPMISSVKPGNIDITFQPDRADLRHELMSRIKTGQEKPQSYFTVRELDIIRCLGKGMCSKEIASVLFISKSTVDTHRQNLIRKWEVTNTAALLKLAMEQGCI